MFSKKRCCESNMKNNCGCHEMNSCEMPQCVTEAPINNCVQRNICHEVKHIIPIHTHE